jgi:site-specific DNA recombinase
MDESCEMWGAVMTTRAIGYVRVSTDDQAREGVSLDVQEARIRAYCEAKGWQLVSIVRDEGKSAKDLKRPGLQEILGALPKRQRCFDALVVVKLDRLTRSVRDLGNLMEAFKRARVGFTSIQESVDTASASGELFFNLVASVSQWERRAIGERTLSAMAYLRAQGWRISRQPRFGARFDAAGRVHADPREQAILSRILRLREAGLSLRAISAELARQGILARSGRPFTASTLGQLVRQGSLADSLAS